MKLIKNNSDWLFIPLLSIGELILSKQRNNTSTINYFDKYLSQFDSQFLNKNNGFIVPLKSIKCVDFYKNKDDIYSQIGSNKIIINTLLRTRNVNMKIEVFDDLLNSKELLPDYDSHITYSLIYLYNETPLWNKGAETASNLDQIKPKFSLIWTSYKLSSEEVELLWELLCSRRTKFCLSKIYAKFNYLSECLTVLNNCAECPELNFINFWYSSSDAENEEEAVKNAIFDFRKKFGFIANLTLRNNGKWK